MKKISLLLVLLMALTLVSSCADMPERVSVESIFKPLILPLTGKSPSNYKNPNIGENTINTATSPVLTTPNELPSVSEIKTDVKLPTFKSHEELLSKFEEIYGSYYGICGTDPEFSAMPMPGGNDVPIAESAADSGMGTADRAAAEQQSNTEKAAHSSTNVQKHDVDEGAIIKTDGEFIYALTKNTVVIIKASGARMEVVSVISTDDDMRINEIYVAGNRLVISGIKYKEFKLPEKPIQKPVPHADFDSGYRNDYWWPDLYSRSYTAFHIYDITNRDAPALLQRFEVSGASMATRVIGDTLYYVTNEYPQYFPWQAYRENNIDTKEEWVLPNWINSISNNSNIVEAEKISYFPDSSYGNFMLVGTLSLSGADKPEPQAYFGGGDTLYMDAEYMAIACTAGYNSWTGTQQTYVYRYTLAKDGVVYTGNAKLDGNIINQYAMDVHNGNLRVAASNTSGNRVSVFDKEMKLLGETGVFAKNETIRSVRFMGDMVYLVTFEVVDPLFCIDLSVPTKPVILGELKIPGFSQYLHPVGNGLLIGFGRDTEETSWGFTDIGFKVSLFDIVDPRDPQEIASIKYSNEEFSSDAFSNPRSIMVDSDKNRFAFPAFGIEYPDSFDLTISDNDIDNYYDNSPEKIWFGVIVVDVADRALKQREIVRHNEYSMMDYYKNIEPEYFNYYYNDLHNNTNTRAIYIGNTFYTIGGGSVSAYDYDSFRLLNTLGFS